MVVLCSKHHKIVDSRPDIYTVEKLIDIKKKHEARFTTKRKVTPIHVPIGELEYLGGKGEQMKIAYWIDETGRPNVYKSEEWERVETIREIAMEIIAVKGEPMRKYKTDSYSRCNASVKIIKLMAQVPDATLYDVLRFAVKDGKADALVASERKRVLKTSSDSLTVR